MTPPLEINDRTADLCDPVPHASDCPHYHNIKQLINAFPDGPEKHRDYHQSLIDANLAQKKFWDDLTLELKKGGIKAIALILIGMVIFLLFGPDTAKAIFKGLI